MINTLDPSFRCAEHRKPSDAPMNLYIGNPVGPTLASHFASFALARRMQNSRPLSPERKTEYVDIGYILFLHGPSAPIRRVIYCRVLLQHPTSHSLRSLNCNESASRSFLCSFSAKRLQYHQPATRSAETLILRENQASDCASSDALIPASESLALAANKPLTHLNRSQHTTRATGTGRYPTVGAGFRVSHLTTSGAWIRDRHPQTTFALNSTPQAPGRRECLTLDWLGLIYRPGIYSNTPLIITRTPNPYRSLHVRSRLPPPIPPEMLEAN
ncbi:hypothetical protein FA13DRAFT_163186 [Coprinellus micaceus]|uniref:Uncharacterized protein n=1 Tax=Coprinellus micaceus TaxID=71717 RepID=A0A4Y7THH0_COPMI|nr:hypothetical protein FA13DRAFT_163186 [Coprinellus micaceus]